MWEGELSMDEYDVPPNGGDVFFFIYRPGYESKRGQWERMKGQGGKWVLQTFSLNEDDLNRYLNKLNKQEP